MKKIKNYLQNIYSKDFLMQSIVSDFLILWNRIYNWTFVNRVQEGTMILFSIALLPFLFQSEPYGHLLFWTMMFILHHGQNNKKRSVLSLFFIGVSAFWIGYYLVMLFM